MNDDDLIRRGDIGPALAGAGFGGELLQAAIRALPAAPAEDTRKEVMPVETNAHTRPATSPGVTAGAIPAEDARAGALKEAAAMVAAFGNESDVGAFANKDHRATARYLSTRILALIPEAKP